MVAALAPFLQGSLRPQHFPRPPTAAAAAVSATRRRGMDNFGVNRNTPLHKGCLITALETAGIRMPRSTGKGGQREKATTGVRKKKEFAKLLATVEVSLCLELSRRCVSYCTAFVCFGRSQAGGECHDV